MRVYASRCHDKKTGSSLRIAWYCLSGSSQPPHTAIARLHLRRSTRRSAETTPPFYHRACSYIHPWSLPHNPTSVAHVSHAHPHPPPSTQPPHTAIARLCWRRSTMRSAETTPSFYHRACSYIPPWSLVRNATSGAPGAHAPNSLPAPYPPSPHRRGNPET